MWTITNPTSYSLGTHRSLVLEPLVLFSPVNHGDELGRLGAGSTLGLDVRSERLDTVKAHDQVAPLDVHAWGKQSSHQQSFKRIMGT